MTRGQPGVVLKHLHSLFRAGAVGGFGEGTLLDRFIERGDEAAFEALVARHGPMVLGVCRRILHEPQDIEDVFQATFLLLVRKAGNLRDREQVGPWLHGVAYRVAVRARSNAWRRGIREAQRVRGQQVHSVQDVERDELRSVLDEELGRLPEKFRAPVVLCFLEGHTHEEAAERLRWPLGTVKSRLAGARERLRGRLTRRGFAPMVVAWLSALTPDAVSAVPPALVASTVRFAVASVLCVTTGQAVSTRVTSLMGSILLEMGMARLKTAIAVGVVALTLGAGGAGALLLGASTGDDPVTARAAASRESGNDQKSGSTRDRWMAESISPAERFGWQPAELVGVLGEHAGKNWELNSSIALSPDGTTVATSEFSARGSIRLWDARTLRERAVVHIPGARVNALVFTPDGKMLVAGCAEGTIAFWSLAAQEPRLASTVRSHDGEVLSLALTGDGKTLASGGADRTVRLWDLSAAAPREQATILNFKQAVRALAITSDGTTLAAATGSTVFVVDDGGGHSKYTDVELRIFDVAKGVPKERRAPTVSSDVGIDALAFHPVNQLLASACTDRFVRIWDLTTTEPKLWESLATREAGSSEPFGAESLVFTHDGKSLAAGGAHEVRLWDLTGPTPKQRMVIPFKNHQAPIKGLAIAADGKRLFVGDSAGSIQLWDLSGPKPQPGDAGEGLVGAVGIRITSDGRTLIALGDRGARLMLWDLTADPPRVRAEIGGGKAGATISTPALSHDGKRLAVQGYESSTKQYSLRLWDLAGKAPRELAAIALGQDESTSLWSAAFSPDGKTLATGMWAGTVLLWKLGAGDPEELFSLQESFALPGSSSTGHVCWVEYSPDGKLLATANWGKVVRVWDVSGEVPNQVARLEGHDDVVRRVSFSPLGKSLASLDDGGVIRVWDVSGGPAKLVLQTNKEGRARLRSSMTLNGGLDYSPDGRLILASCLDGLVTLWDAKTGEERHRWALPGAVWDAAFLADGRHVATGNGNGTVYILRLPSRVFPPAQAR